MGAFWLSTVVVFLAELGDKSQLMALAFATRYRWWHVLAGISAATAAVHAVAVLAGATLRQAVPTQAITVLAGVAFLIFALWTLRGDTLTEAEAARAARTAGVAVLTVAAAFALAELGDKTMLATLTLATREGWLGTWAGSTIGMVAADALAILAGNRLGRLLPERVIKVGAAAAFAVFGVLLILSAVA